MVEQGHAIAFRRYSLAYVAAEERARKARRGLWRASSSRRKIFAVKAAGGQNRSWLPLLALSAYALKTGTPLDVVAVDEAPSRVPAAPVRCARGATSWARLGFTAFGPLQCY